MPHSISSNTKIKIVNTPTLFLQLSYICRPEHSVEKSTDEI
jgi:hypothetical protein